MSFATPVIVRGSTSIPDTLIDAVSDVQAHTNSLSSEFRQFKSHYEQAEPAKLLILQSISSDTNRLRALVDSLNDIITLLNEIVTKLNNTPTFSSVSYAPVSAGSTYNVSFHYMISDEIVPRTGQLECTEVFDQTHFLHDESFTTSYHMDTYVRNFNFVDNEGTHIDEFNFSNGFRHELRGEDGALFTSMVYQEPITIGKPYLTNNSTLIYFDSIVDNGSN